MKDILIEYTAQIPVEYFDKFCKKTALGKKDSVICLKEAAITAGENEIDRILMSLDTYNK